MKQFLLRHFGFRLNLSLSALGAACFFSACSSTAVQPVASWGSWPAGLEPTTIGTRVVQNLLDRPKLDLSGGGLTYQETCCGYGAIRFAAAVNNPNLLNQVVARYQGIIASGTRLPPPPNHVDRSVFGILPLELFKNTQDQQYLALGLKYADVQFATLNPAGLSSETRYYIDDAYKLCVMQILAYGATQKADYAANAVKEMSAFIDQLQQPTGLFFHGPDAHVYWGRGNGWIAAALTEMLLYLPASDPARAKIMASYQAMMAGLLKYQAADGRWRQVIDDDQAWEENSSTGYFIFSLGEGVDQGWLDAATYRPVVKKAWDALCGQLDAQGNILDVGGVTEHSNDVSYYLAIPRTNGNLHGQFAAIWAATALLDQKH
jgi:rhamnogalacturonyl hydrolase YesR